MIITNMTPWYNDHVKAEYNKKRKASELQFRCLKSVKTEDEK